MVCLAVCWLCCVVLCCVVSCRVVLCCVDCWLCFWLSLLLSLSSEASQSSQAGLRCFSLPRRQKLLFVLARFTTFLLWALKSPNSGHWGMLYAFGCLLFVMSFAAMISTDPLCSPPVCQAPPRQRRRRRQCWDAMVSQLLGEPFIRSSTTTPHS